MSDLSGPELYKVGLIYWLFLPMVALSMARIIILFKILLLKAIFAAPLSLTADAIYAYCKYVIFFGCGDLFGCDLHIAQSPFALAMCH